MKKLGIFILCGFLVGMGMAKESRMKKRSTASIPETSSSVKKPNNRLEAWLKRMRRVVSSTQTKNNRLVAVAAVRGDQVSDAPPLYWKGKPAEKKISDQELDAFNQLLEAASKGDEVETKMQVDSFLSSYPTSSLRPDAEKTLKLLAMDDSE